MYGQNDISGEIILEVTKKEKLLKTITKLCDVTSKEGDWWKFPLKLDPFFPLKIDPSYLLKYSNFIVEVLGCKVLIFQYI